MNPHIELTQKYTNFYFGCTKKGWILKWWCLLWLTQTISHSAWESWWCGSLARAQPALELPLPYFRAHKPPPPMLGFILSFRVNENVEALGPPTWGALVNRFLCQQWNSACCSCFCPQKCSVGYFLVQNQQESQGGRCCDFELKLKDWLKNFVQFKWEATSLF